MDCDICKRVGAQWWDVHGKRYVHYDCRIIELESQATENANMTETGGHCTGCGDLGANNQDAEKNWWHPICRVTKLEKDKRELIQQAEEFQKLKEAWVVMEGKRAQDEKQSGQAAQQAMFESLQTALDTIQANCDRLERENQALGDELRAVRADHRKHKKMILAALGFDKEWDLTRVQTADICDAIGSLQRTAGECALCADPNVEDPWRHEHGDKAGHWHHCIDPGDGLASDCAQSDRLERLFGNEQADEKLWRKVANEAMARAVEVYNRKGSVNYYQVLDQVIAEELGGGGPVISERKSSGKLPSSPYPCSRGEEIPRKEASQDSLPSSPPPSSQGARNIGCRVQGCTKPNFQSSTGLCDFHEGMVRGLSDRA